MMKNYVLKILLRSIPNLIGVMLTACLQKVTHWKNLRRGNSNGINHVTVYDVLNAGPRHCYTVLGDRPIIAHNCVQKTAHMILQLWQYFVMQEIWKEEIPYYWHLMDFHDEFIMCVKIEDAPRVVDIYKRTLDKVNNEYLKGQVKIKADPQLATCLAEIKVEKYLYEPYQDILEKANSLLSEN